MTESISYIGLGSNQGDRKTSIRRAFDLLAQVPESSLLAHSDLYRTPAWGETNQADFINAVAKLRTAITATALLQHLQEIEGQLGRQKSSRRWAPRVIDLDLLLHGPERVNTEFLSLPHPHMHERAFVLLPLLELDAEIKIPGHGLARNSLSALPGDEIAACIRLPS